MVSPYAVGKSDQDRVALGAHSLQARPGDWSLQQTNEIAFWVSSVSDQTPERWNEWVRDHWRIENGSHYVRDTAFAEDASRIRKNPDIVARLRSFAYNLTRAQGNHFTFATRQAESAYTLVLRDPAGQVTRVIETREEGGGQTRPGERDIGLFVFRKTAVLNMLREELSGKWGRSTGEHGFLYIVEHMVSRGLRVAALPVATELDLVSLNSIEDVEAYLS